MKRKNGLSVPARGTNNNHRGIPYSIKTAGSVPKLDVFFPRASL
jgi:hypothetical protein